MTVRTPIVLDNGKHVPMASGDSLGGSVAISQDPGNTITQHPDGLFAGGAATLPWAKWELGNSGQPNGGRGIDMGDWWRLDMRQGYQSRLDLTFDGDGYVSMPSGQYLVLLNARLSKSAATGAWKCSYAPYGYTYPGVYQEAVSFFTSLDGTSAMSTVSVGGETQATAKLYFGYDKGSDQSARLQGYVTIVRVGQ